MVVEAFDFSVIDGQPDSPADHMHNEVEISVFEHGSVTMLYGGASVIVPPNHLVVHWGIVPHGCLRREPHANALGVRIPLAWLLQWDLPSTLQSRLLSLEVLIDVARSVPCSDQELLRFWVSTLRSKGKEGREMVLLELRSRLLRLAMDYCAEDVSTQPTSGTVKVPRMFERAVEFIARHFREHIQIRDIAEAVGVTPRHISRIFREVSGHTLNGYIRRLRLSDAQQLLVTTDRKVIDIMYASGFRSITRFYQFFQQQAGCSPDHYRREHHTASSVHGKEGKKSRSC